jgi:hypothetical protein
VGLGRNKTQLLALFVHLVQLLCQKGGNYATHTKEVKCWAGLDHASLIWWCWAGLDHAILGADERRLDVVVLTWWSCGASGQAWTTRSWAA